MKLSVCSLISTCPAEIDNSFFCEETTQLIKFCITRSLSRLSTVVIRQALENGTAKKPRPCLFTQKYPNPFCRHVHGQAYREDRIPSTPVPISCLSSLFPPFLHPLLTRLLISTNILCAQVLLRTIPLLSQPIRTTLQSKVLRGFFCCSLST